MSQATVLMKQGFTMAKQVAGQLGKMYAHMAHLMKTNPALRPIYKWWETRFWLKEESCYLNRGRARLYTYLGLYLLIRSRSAKNKAAAEVMKWESKDEIIATALRIGHRSAVKS